MRAQGYLVITDPYASPLERDTLTCAHCNTITIVELRGPAANLGGFCRLCMASVCLTCADGACEPFEARLLKMESADRFRRSLGA